MEKIFLITILQILTTLKLNLLNLWIQVDVLGRVDTFLYNIWAVCSPPFMKNFSHFTLR